METVLTPVRSARVHYRHDLRSLIYVVLDTGNGGIIRNLSDRGAGIQAVGALRANQTVRIQFELRFPRLRIDTRAEVIWSASSGQCGVRFLDLPPRQARQIDEWILGNLLECIPHNTSANIFALPVGPEPVVKEDGLLVSAASRNVIALEPPKRVREGELQNRGASGRDASMELDWLSQPLSGRSVAWMVDSLIVVAALLLFSLIFLSVAHELPRWPLSLGLGLGAAIFVVAFYWGFFRYFAGASLGERLARLTEPGDGENEEEAARFR